MGLVTTLRQQELRSGLHSLLPMHEQMSFALLQLDKDRYHFESQALESALVLIQGEATVSLETESFAKSSAFEPDQKQQTLCIRRQHWQEENPFVLHLSPHSSVTIASDTQCRFGLVQTPNAQTFASRVYLPTEVTTEHRGKGLLGDAAYRRVRTVFDASIAPPEAQLVLGEVVNFPGCWSSYPPHHHLQNELYYYEFDPIVGFGFGQCGETVERIHHQDLLFIDGAKDHAQVAAPGYWMYYIWAIRHGEEIYKGFEYTAPHDRLVTGL